MEANTFAAICKMVQEGFDHEVITHKKVKSVGKRLQLFKLPDGG